MQAAQPVSEPIDPEGRKRDDPPVESTGSIDDRISNRVPLETQVEMHFEDFDGFITECSMNISATGMFIASRNPQPAGSVLDFKFALADGDKLIRGYGEVIWARRRDDGPERPAGMGIRFLHLDAESRELIRWTVTRRYITGAGPCDVDEVKSAMRRAAEREAAGMVPPDPEPAAATAAASVKRRPSKATSRSRYREAGYGAAAAQPPASGWRLRLVAAAAALMLGGLYLLQATSTSVEASRPAPASPELAAAGVAENPPQPPFARGGSGEEQPASPEVAAEEAVKDWARAWSRQEPDGYLASYAADFRPPGNLSRGDWQEQRRVRIQRPRWIQIELGAIVTELENAGRARVTFDQSYRSNSYHDTVRKTLVMVHEDAGWRILEEHAEG